MNTKHLRATLLAALLSNILPAQSGSLDSTFGTGGKVLAAIGSGDDLAHAAALQSDGKIVVAGWSHQGAAFDFALARFSADGDLDDGFGAGGKLTTPFGSHDDYATAVAVQADGKIVAAGWTFNGTDLDFALARYNADGNLDNSFGTGGRQTSDLGSDDYIAEIAIQTDGKIVVAGHTIASSGTLDFALARYHPNGTPDTGFGTGGTVATDFYQSSDFAASLALLPDGKIVVAGLAVTGPDYDFALARYHTDGSLDHSFGTGGKITTPFGPSDDKGISVIVQPDGKIVVGGYLYNGADYDFAVARYNADGSLDHDFGTGGKTITDFDGKDNLIAAVALQADGKIVAAGRSSHGGHYNFALARYTENGVLDGSFGTAGKVVTPVGAGLNSAFSVLLQPGGKIVLAGYAHDGTDYDFALARYHAGGSVGIHDEAGGDVTASVYPNPAHQSATLDYILDRPEILSIRLLDVQGNIIRTILENEPQLAGKHRQTVVLPEGLPPGLYSISIHTMRGGTAIMMVKN